MQSWATSCPPRWARWHSLDPAVGEVSHKNANDQTCEGVRYKNFPCFTVQFHPEACGGPQDTAYLFDEFIDMIKSSKEAK